MKNGRVKERNRLYKCGFYLLGVRVVRLCDSEGNHALNHSLPSTISLMVVNKELTEMRDSLSTSVPRIGNIWKEGNHRIFRHSPSPS